MAFQKNSDKTNSDERDQSQANENEKDTTRSNSSSESDKGSSDKGEKSNEQPERKSEKSGLRKVVPNVDGDAHKEAKKKAEEEEKKEKKSLNKVARKAGSSAAAYGAKSFIAMQIANALKVLLMMLMQLMNAIASAISTVVAGVVHFIASVAVAFGVTMLTATLGLVGFFVGGVILVGGTVASNSQQTTEIKTDAVLPDDPCEGREDTQYTAVGDDTSQEERARMVYNFFGNYYKTNTKEKVAGILGNWSVESGITFFKMEGSPSSDKMILYGNDEKALDNYTSGWLFPTYYRGWGASACSTSYSSFPGQTRTHSNTHHNLATSAYVAHNNGKSMFVPGIGIGQWTGQRGKDLLNLAANTDGYDWYDAEIQLAYMVSIDSRANWVQNWANTATGNPEEGAKQFGYGWEGDISGSENARVNAAKEWFIKIAAWDADINYYNTVVTIAGDAFRAAAGANNAQNHEDECTEEELTYGTTVAERMSAYCWDSHSQSCDDFIQAWTARGKPMGTYNNHPIKEPWGTVCGTDLYIQVHQAVFPGDGLYASCDRSVACAVRWAGLDDNFPAGGCGTLINWMSASSKWKNVKSDIHSESDLMPGDILIRSTHVIMYLGSDAVLKYHPNAEASWVYGSGSYGDRPPNVQGDNWSGYDYVFRNVQPESNSKWFNIIE
jgi:hypothetical protein